MRNEYLKTLWTLRFEKLRRSEEAAAWKYQEILNRCLSEFGADHSIIALLTQLVNEERMHERLADELIQICHQSHPECHSLSE